MLLRFGVAAERIGRFRDAVDALDEAVELYRETGDVLGEARAMNNLVLPLIRLGDPRGWTLSARSLALLEPLGPSKDLVDALTETAVDDAIQGRYQAAVESTERAMRMARDLGLEAYPRALGFRGLARTGLGDAGGLADMREAITLARAAGHARDVGAISNNLATALWAFEGPAPAVAEMRGGIDYAAERGLADMAFSIECGSLDALVDLGELDHVIQFASDTAPGLEAKGEIFNLMTVRAAQARALSIRGTVTDAKPWLDAFEASARQLGSADFMSALASAVVIRFQLGQGQTADELLDEIEDTKLFDTTPNYFMYLPAMVRACVTHGRVEVVERLLARPEPVYPSGTPAFATSRAALAEVRGDLDAASAAYRDAATTWASFGNIPEEGFALLGLGRTTLAGARPDEARLELTAAKSIFERLHGQPALTEIEGLLAGGPV
jgi:tetratricopeptide (TPR) repeat protein